MLMQAFLEYYCSWSLLVALQSTFVTRHRVKMAALATCDRRVPCGVAARSVTVATSVTVRLAIYLAAITYE